MKKVWVFLLCLATAVAIWAAAVGEQPPAKLAWGSVETISGSWASTADAEVFSYPMGDTAEPVLLLRSSCTEYEIAVDGVPVYTAPGGQYGAFYLFRLPQGQTLTVRFAGAAPEAARASAFWFGSRGGMYRMLVRENWYAAVFWCFSVLLGAGSVLAGFYLRTQHFNGLFQRLVSLGAYILTAGIWVLTDSKFLFLFSQRSVLVALISYISFYTLQIPLLQFTKAVLPAKRQLLTNFQWLFAGVLALLLVNQLAHLPLLWGLLVAEHILIFASLGFILYFGFRQLRQQADKALTMVMRGYVFFAFCSLDMLLSYYQGNTRNYSLAYVLGILGFVVFMACAAWLAILEQVRENANVALYARMAYTDGMTGMGNRRAFEEDTQKSAHTAKTLGYIMVDVNGLKQVNDTLGHPQGDALIVAVAQCIQRAVDGYGKGYRIGGDEFILCLEGKTEQDVEACAAHLRKELCTANAQSELPISAALGWAWCSEADETPEALFRQADDRMYAEKKQAKAGRSESR